MRQACLLLALLAPACNTPKNPYPPRTAAEEAQYEEAIDEGRIVLGMTRDEARRAWGSPMKKDTVTFRGEEVERWMYPFSEFYFDRWGRVVGIRGPG